MSVLFAVVPATMETALRVVVTASATAACGKVSPGVDMEAMGSRTEVENTSTEVNIGDCLLPFAHGVAALRIVML